VTTRLKYVEVEKIGDGSMENMNNINEFGTTGTTGTTGTIGQESGSAGTKEQIKEKMTQKVNEVGTIVQDRTNKALESTSKSVDRVAMYLKDKDSQAMLQDLQQVVRKHPGKSLVAGLLLGMMVGKIMR
jgi:hypothetical protein